MIENCNAKPLQKTERLQLVDFFPIGTAKSKSLNRSFMNRIYASALLLLCTLVVVALGGQGSGTLKGKIETDKGKPINGAEVRVLRSRDRSIKETKTDAEGKFSFELVPDDYTVSFDAEGYQGGTLVQMQQVEEGKETILKTIRLSKATRRTSLIRGAVFDSVGASLAGVNLKLLRVPTADEEKDNKRVDSFSMSYTTNSHGEFAFRVPAVRARYRVTASLNGYKLETKFVDVNENESVPLSFSLEPVKK
jgi:hypothetical protein